MIKKSFASDNNSGVSPEVLQKIAEVNEGHVLGYGNDTYTFEAIQLIKKHFGPSAIPYFVFTGTAANVLGITASTRSYNSIFCTETAHIQVDECGTPERFAGCKLIPVASSDGKITPRMLKRHMKGFGFEHHSQPALVSISQPTELGTVYKIDEIKDLSAFVHHYGLRLHMDGARLANAAVALNCGFKDITVDAGIDILSFGGTKNGLMFAESVIFFDERITTDFKYIRKQGMQLSSKMRYIAAQFIAYLEDDLWKRNASHANAMASLLAEHLKEVTGINILQKVESNGVFVCIPKDIIPVLQKDFFFYVDEERGEVRWMTSFDTTKDDVRLFAQRIKELLNKSGSGISPKV